MANRLLVAVEEGFWAGDKSADGILKDLITADRMIVERKGIDASQIKNCIRILMSANDDWVVPATRDERRYCVLDVGNKHKQDKSYFTAICYQLDHEGGLERMLYDLLNYPLDLDLNKIPQTVALSEQKAQSFSCVEQFVSDALMSEVIARSPTGHDIFWDEETIEKQAIYNLYLEHCRQRGLRRAKNQQKFFTEVYKMIPSIKHRNIRATNTSAGFKQGGVRPKGLLLPFLEDAKTEFDQYCGFCTDWEN
jgi:phage/plasmid-associated DNA primase